MITQERRTDEGRVEDLLRQVEAIPETGADGPVSQFELWVPERLTLHGRRIPQDVAIVVVLDALLLKSFVPSGYTEEPGGRMYRYERSDPAI